MVKPKHRGWTQNEVQDELRYYEDGYGSLVWRRGNRKGKVAGWKDSNGYLLVRFKGVLVRAHNLVWLYHTGEWPDFEIDHKNNIPWDNSFKNLRPATRHVQGANQTLQKRREGEFKGVHQSSSGNYYVKIKKHGVQYHGGSFPTKEQAAVRYNELAELLFGEYAKLNEV
jgi:hypothetical protein